MERRGDQRTGVEAAQERALGGEVREARGLSVVGRTFDFILRRVN